MPGVDPDLGEDVGQVVLDRLARQIELGRHLAVDLPEATRRATTCSRAVKPY
jgi:hypothetical protein